MDGVRYNIFYEKDDSILNDGWYLKIKEYDYYWLKWTDFSIIKIRFCPFCGKELK